MEINIPIQKDKYYKGALKLISCISNISLTDSEINVISKMLENNIKEINVDSRITLRTILNMTEYNLNNYIKRLKDKKILIKINDTLSLNPNIIKLSEHSELKVTISVN